jgi:PKD repeat protein
MRGLPLLLLLLFVSSHAFPEEKPTAPSLRFTRNDGQWDKNVLYRAALPGGFLFVKKQSLQYVFYDARAVAAQHVHGHASDAPSPGPVARTAFGAPPAASDPGTIRAHGFEVQFGGAGGRAEIMASGEMPERRNYFLGDDRAQWASNVPSYEEIRYRNLYPGIDLRLFAHNGTAKYEFIVSPGADPGQIKLVYEGATGLALKDGFLVTTTTVNTVTETPPYCYQAIRNGPQEVRSQYVLRGNVLTFGFPAGYRRDLPLVIDPYLVFSTYSGSVTDNWGFTATYDEAGNLYSGGIEFGPGFPATTGAFQVKFSAQTDVAVLKYNPEGTRLLYATYLGGGGIEVPHSLIVNKANELIILGTTASTNFPTTANAYDRQLGRGAVVDPLAYRIINANGDTLNLQGGITYLNGSDLFVAKLNDAGTALLGSTFLGGTANDGLYIPEQAIINGDRNVSKASIIKNYGDQFRGDVNVDDAGNIYVASTTTSNNFPTVNAAQTTLKGGQDAVVCRFSPDLSALSWSTYLGGSGTDVATSLRIGASGAVYVCGGTTSRDLSAGAGVIKPAFSDNQDGFVARLSPTSAAPVLSYLGTDGLDQAYLIDLDQSENVYVMGLTLGQYPVTGNVYRNGNSGQFIHALNNTFTQTLFSTVIGSGRQSPDISPTAFMVSDCGFIYLTGWGGDINRQQGEATSSTAGLPVTPDALRGNTNGDDFYLMILSTNAASLLYGSFIGSPERQNHVDGGTSRFRKDGTIYHAVCACRDNSSFPTTPNVWSRVNNGNAEDEDNTASDGCNNLAFKFALNTLQAAFDGELAVCSPYTGSYQNKSLGATTSQWEVDGKPVAAASGGALTYTFDTPGTYTISLRVNNPATCKQTDVVTKTIKVTQSTPISVSPGVRICAGDTARLWAEGGAQYEWLPAAGLSDPTSPTPVATPAQTTEYRVKITNTFGCTKELRTRVEVYREITAAFDVILSSECGKPNRVRLVNKSANAVRYEWLLGDSSVVTGETPAEFEYGRPGEYIVTLKASNDECGTTTSQRVRVEDPELPPNVITPNGDAWNELFVLPNPGWKLEVYDRWGKHVYTNAAYQNDWGNDVQGGVYFYRITSPLGAACKGWLHVLK